MTASGPVLLDGEQAQTLLEHVLTEWMVDSNHPVAAALRAIATGASVVVPAEGLRRCIWVQGWEDSWHTGCGEHFADDKGSYCHGCGYVIERVLADPGNANSTHGTDPRLDPILGASSEDVQPPTGEGDL